MYKRQLATEVMLAALVLILARPVGGAPRWWRTSGGAFVAGAVMAAAMAPIAGTLWLALPAGAGAYGAALYLFELRSASGDLDVIRTILRRTDRATESPIES